MGESPAVSERLSPLIQFLRQIAGPPPDRDLADGHLLERFVTARDQAAFAALMQRHGPMVLGVCRRLLHDAHEAEDAFQATFLVLYQRVWQAYESLQALFMELHYLPCDGAGRPSRK